MVKQFIQAESGFFPHLKRLSATTIIKICQFVQQPNSGIKIKDN